MITGTDTVDEVMDMREDQEGEQEVLVRTFLIADIRGYTRFTKERGDEAAAALAARFAALAREAVEPHRGRLLELRGDEALAVFSSTRQALRAAEDLQIRCSEWSQEHPELALPVGIGVDAGEAVAVEGGFRGAALNTAARLCSDAGPGEILTTEAVSHLAGRVEGLRFVDVGPRSLKGLPESLRVIRVESESRELISPVRASAPEPPAMGTEDAFGRDIDAMVQRQLSRTLESIEENLHLHGSVSPEATGRQTASRWLIALGTVVAVAAVVVLVVWLMVH